MKPSKGKFDSEKPRVDLIPPGAILEVAKAFQDGAAKYEDNDWRGGMRWGRVYAAVQRHLLAWWGGEDIDSESGLLHLAHAATGVMFLITYQKEHPEMDDRYTITGRRLSEE